MKPIKGVMIVFSNYDEILTVADVCEILYIGRNTAYALLSEGKVRSFQIGRTWRIPRQSLEEYILRKCGKDCVS